LRRLPPSTNYGQDTTAIENPRCKKFGFETLVAGECETAAHIHCVVGADEFPVARSEDEAAAGIGTFEERVPRKVSAQKHVFRFIDEFFGAVRLIRLHLAGLLSLCFCDQTGAGLFLGLAPWRKQRSND
jgi:hypothetical protein